MEKTFISNLALLSQKRCACCLSKFGISECVCCNDFREDMHKILEVQISNLIQQFRDIELVARGLEEAHEPADLIRRQYDKLYKIICALRPVAEKVSLNFPHLNNTFDTIISLYEKPDITT